MHKQTEWRPEDREDAGLCSGGKIVCQKTEKDLRGSAGTEEGTVPPRVGGK